MYEECGVIIEVACGEIFLAELYPVGGLYGLGTDVGLHTLP